MFDVWLGDIELTTFILIFAFVVLLPIQLLLCFKVKSKGIRLLPVMIFSVLTIIFVVKASTVSGWDSLGYTFFAIFTAFMLLICGSGWCIWGVTRLIKRKRENTLIM